MEGNEIKTRGFMIKTEFNLISCTLVVRICSPLALGLVSLNDDFTVGRSVVKINVPDLQQIRGACLQTLSHGPEVVCIASAATISELVAIALFLPGKSNLFIIC